LLDKQWNDRSNGFTYLTNERTQSIFGTMINEPALLSGWALAIFSICIFLPFIYFIFIFSRFEVAKRSKE
jgi:hypothetical protein